MDATLVTADLLRGWPLPQPAPDGDKDSRGCVLCIGGASEMPGAIVLTAAAALRAGAGKLQIGTARSVGVSVGIAMPEARVFGWPETKRGGLRPSIKEAAARVNGSAATVIGPGMLDDEAVDRLVCRLLPRVEGTPLVLDAAALKVLESPAAAEQLPRLRGHAVLTPHAGEMASMLGIPREEVCADPRGSAREAARRWNAVVALKGGDTYIAAPDGYLHHFDGGHVGLATSGSGDTLAGVIGGLAARGAPPLQAAVWGVYLHGAAGQRLASRVGPLGFLAREILDEIPALMATLIRDSPAAAE